MSYENKFVANTLEEEGDSRVAFRLKQAEYTGQQGDVLFLSPYYPNCVLEGKKLTGKKEKEPDTSYNTYYFGKHSREQFKQTREFAKNAGVLFLYFFYVTFGRGHAAEFHVIPALRFEEKIELDDTVAVSLQEMRWWSLDDPWFEYVSQL